MENKLSNAKDLKEFAQLFFEKYPEPNLASTTDDMKQVSHFTSYDAFPILNIPPNPKNSQYPKILIFILRRLKIRTGMLLGSCQL